MNFYLRNYYRNLYCFILYLYIFYIKYIVFLLTTKMFQEEKLLLFIVNRHLFSIWANMKPIVSQNLCCKEDKYAVKWNLCSIWVPIQPCLEVGTMKLNKPWWIKSKDDFHCPDRKQTKALRVTGVKINNPINTSWLIQNKQTNKKALTRIHNLTIRIWRYVGLTLEL